MIADLDTPAFKHAVIEAPTPVLVDFHATWCAPCSAQAPILENLARTLGKAARVVKVDVDRSPELAGLFGVRSIPTLLVFSKGRITHRFTGVTAGARLAAALAEELA